MSINYAEMPHFKPAVKAAEENLGLTDNGWNQALYRNSDIELPILKCGLEVGSFTEDADCEYG